MQCNHADRDKIGENGMHEEFFKIVMLILNHAI